MMHTEQQRLAYKALELKRANRVLSFAEVCEIIGCSKKHFHCAIKHQLRVIMISTRMRGVRESDLEAWLQKKTREAA